MYRRDYFLKLLQQFNKVLQKLMGLKEAGETERAKEIIEEAYKEFFGLEGTYLQSLDKTDLIEVLKEKHHFKDDQLEVLARLFYEESEVNIVSSGLLLSKSLFLLEHLNESQKIYSFEREDLMKKIRQRLSDVL